MKWLRRFPFLLRLLQAMKRVTLPGFRGIPLYFAIRFYFERLLDESINLKASAIAFNLFLGTIPGLMFLLTLIPYLPLGDLDRYIMMVVREGLPPGVVPIIEKTVYDVIHTPRTGLLSLTLIIALYFASNGIYAMIETFDIHDPRSFIKKRIVAIWMTLVIMAFSLVTIALYLGLGFLINWLGNGWLPAGSWELWLLEAAKYGFSLAFIWLTFSFIYFYGPRSSMRWKRFSPGAVLATILLVVTSAAVGYYFEHFARYNLIYGSLGALIALMLWFYFNAVAIVVGYELNRGLVYARKQLGTQRRRVQLKK